MVNTNLLRQKIISSGLKLKHISSNLNLTTYGLQRKIENVNEFKLNEVTILCTLLSIDVDEKEKIFFAPKVENNSTDRISE